MPLLCLTLPPRDKAKWAFFCRPTVMTLGMAATQRTEGLFRVSKRAGVEKKLSLCALWEKLQRVIKTLEVESARRVSQDWSKSRGIATMRAGVKVASAKAVSHSLCPTCDVRTIREPWFTLSVQGGNASHCSGGAFPGSAPRQFFRPHQERARARRR